MADVFEDETEVESTISIKDYLNAVEEEELEADLVLGGDEGKECTYNKGYMKRQAIFSCLTCTPDGNAGVCTACCLSCHDGHEMVELWTKRNFRCDCGNTKFGEFFCKLLASKDVENSENAYNHNFKGTYCTCDLPYPDPNAEDQVEMIQCCICEDWFHEEHIGLQSPVEIPRNEDGEPLCEDFICQGCAVLCSFLTHYPQTISLPDPSQSVKNKEVLEKSPAETPSENLEVENYIPGSSVSDVTSDNLTDPSHSVKNKGVLEKSPAETTSENLEVENNVPGSSVSDVTFDNLPVDANVEGTLKDATAVADPSMECIIGIDLIKNPPTLENSKPMFLSRNWRDVLCRCKICSDFYVQKGIGFLLDKEDSIAEYERMAKLKRNENIQKQEGLEQNFLNNLGHVEKMEILTGIADMKNEFCAFMETSDPSKAVTTADIHQVFENLAKKRKHMP